MGWLIAAAIVLLIYWMPVGIRGVYDAAGIAVYMQIGPFRSVLYPREKTEKKQKKKKPESGIREYKPATESKKEKGNVRELLPLLRLILDLLVDLKTKLRMDLLEADVVLGGNDPCDLAVNYGRTWSAVGNLIPQLERFFVIRKRDIRISCDFTSPKTTVQGCVHITITVGRVVCLLGYHGIRILFNYLKIINKSKGGAQA